MNNDTYAEIIEAATGQYNNYHSPILTAMWHLVWGAGSGRVGY